MHNARYDAGLAECSDDGFVVDASHFDRSDTIDDSFCFACDLHLLSHCRKAASVVLHCCWLNDDTSKVVAKQPLGPTFGTVDRNDAESLCVAS